MNDTSPEIEAMVRERIMSRSNEERFVMGTQMFEAARQMVLASLPKDLSPAELRSALFQRMYGLNLKDFVSNS